MPDLTGFGTLTSSCTQSEQSKLWPGDCIGSALYYYGTCTLTPVEPLTDDLSDMDKTTAREILNAPPILLFLASKQQNTLGVLPEEVRHPAVALLRTYVEEGIPDHMGLPWLP